MIDAVQFPNQMFPFIVVYLEGPGWNIIDLRRVKLELDQWTSKDSAEKVMIVLNEEFQRQLKICNP